MGEGRGECVLHPSTAAGPVAVVEVETLALEDEGAYAVLQIQVSVAPLTALRG